MPHANAQDSEDEGAGDEDDASMTKVSSPHAAHAAAQRRQCSALGLTPPMQRYEDEDDQDDLMDDDHEYDRQPAKQAGCCPCEQSISVVLRQHAACAGPGWALRESDEEA